MEDEHFEDVEAFFDACQQLRGKRVGIVGYPQIDGDAAGSQIALFEILKNMAGMPFLIEPETGILDNLKFLYEGDELHRPSDLSVEEWCVVDCGMPNRPGKPFEALRPFLLIDHHLPRPTFALHNFVHPRAAATCENLADCLYQKNFPFLGPRPRPSTPGSSWTRVTTPMTPFGHRLCAWVPTVWTRVFGPSLWLLWSTTRSRTGNFPCWSAFENPGNSMPMNSSVSVFYRMTIIEAPAAVWRTPRVLSTILLRLRCTHLRIAAGIQRDL